MAGTYTDIQLHFVFSTKRRAAFITPELRPRLYEYLGGIVRRADAVLYQIGGALDHVHLLVRWRQDLRIQDFLRELKSASSGWVHKTFPHLRAFAWQAGYGAFSVSHSQSDRVKRYIAGQEDHHRRRDFNQEFIGLLRRHEIEYDEERIWD